MEEEFKILPQEYSVTGYKYEQVKRGEKAIYYCCKETATYEVFLITTKKATVVFNKAVPAREIIPSNSNFGQWAWCVFSEEKAAKIFQQLESGEKGHTHDNEVHHFEPLEGYAK